jgi:hypothetical protein
MLEGELGFAIPGEGGIGVGFRAGVAAVRGGAACGLGGEDYDAGGFGKGLEDLEGPIDICRKIFLAVPGKEHAGGEEGVGGAERTPCRGVGGEGSDGGGIEAFEGELGAEFLGAADGGEDIGALGDLAEKEVATDETGGAGDEEGSHRLKPAGRRDGSSGGWSGLGAGGWVVFGFLILLALDAVFFDYGAGVVVGIGQGEEVVQQVGVAGLDLLGLLNEGFALFDEFGEAFFLLGERGELAVEIARLPTDGAGGLAEVADLGEKEDANSEGQ